MQLKRVEPARALDGSSKVMSRRDADLRLRADMSSMGRCCVSHSEGLCGSLNGTMLR